MACCNEDETTMKMRACNSVIRNQNHILKCTLKTLLDNPTRTRDRALSSLIGLYRKQCNGPVVQCRPKKIMSMPEVVLPLHYTPVCPPPIILKSKKEAEVKEEEKVEVKTKRIYPKLARNKPNEKGTSKARDVSDSQNCKQCCVCCGKCCCICCCPQPRSTSPKDFFKAPTSSCGVRTPFSQKTQRCSRRCCLPQNLASPLTMSPLCCPPPVKTLSPKATNKSKCTPIVRSFKETPPPVGRKKEQQGRQSSSPSRARAAPSSRPVSAPDLIPGASRNDLCKNNIGYNSYFSNFCRNNNDSEVDPPGVYTSLSSTHRPPDMGAGNSFFSSTTKANPQNLRSQMFVEKMRDAGQVNTFIKPSEYPSPALRSARDDPFSITTWKTSKPVRFTNLPKGKKK